MCSIATNNIGMPNQQYNSPAGNWMMRPSQGTTAQPRMAAVKRIIEHWVELELNVLFLGVNFVVCPCWSNYNLYTYIFRNMGVLDMCWLFYVLLCYWTCAYINSYTCVTLHLYHCQTYMQYNLVYVDICFFSDSKCFRGWIIYICNLIDLRTAPWNTSQISTATQVFCQPLPKHPLSHIILPTLGRLMLVSCNASGLFRKWNVSWYINSTGTELHISITFVAPRFP